MKSSGWLSNEAREWLTIFANPSSLLSCSQVPVSVKFNLNVRPSPERLAARKGLRGRPIVFSVAIAVDAVAEKVT
jgi:hypothetical protein